MKLKVLALLLMPMIAFANNVTIVPLSKVELPFDVRNKEMEKNAEQRRNGYIFEESDYAQNLMRIEYKPEYEKYKSPLDTHLKKSYKDIKIAFDYKPYEHKNIIGYSPIGTYMREETKTPGWTGVREFFKDDFLGACSVSTINIYISGGSVKLCKETIKYDVNKKPTSIEVEGSENTGFVYTVRWFDEKFIHELVCANKAYKKEITERTINLAKQIDKI